MGIMVGRGNAPVNFDTQSFQQRLETIAGEFGRDDDGKKQIDLDFYKVLDQPAPKEKGVQKIAQKKTAQPVSPSLDTAATPALKTSTKKKTFQKKASAKPVQVNKNSAAKAKPQAPAPVKKKGVYTIQVAAYRDNKDAVAHMASLEEKGINAYRQTGKKDGVTWYRVRTGSFGTLEEAKKVKALLVKKKIKAMIIKKDSHEDI